MSIVVVRVLLACVYLLPGLSKLRVSGLDWALSNNLIHQMHLKWFIHGRPVLWPRVDEIPTLVTVGGLLVLAFELGFIALIWTRRGRLLAAVGGLAFHATTAHFLYIHFPSLWGCYVVLWNGPLRQPRATGATHDAFTLRSELFAVMSGAVLIIAVAIQGVRRETQAWPFACYPDFAHLIGASVTDLAIDVEFADGAVRTLRPPRTRPNHEWGMVWRILGLYDGRPHVAGLESYGRILIARSVTPEGPRPVGMRFFAEEYSTDPDQNTRQPIRRRLLHVGNGNR